MEQSWFYFPPELILHSLLPLFSQFLSRPGLLIKMVAIRSAGSFKLFLLLLFVIRLHKLILVAGIYDSFLYSQGSLNHSLVHLFSMFSHLVSHVLALYLQCLRAVSLQSSTVIQFNSYCLSTNKEQNMTAGTAGMAP